jgi:hypothetical protein
MGLRHGDEEGFDADGLLLKGTADRVAKDDEPLLLLL